MGQTFGKGFARWFWARVSPEVVIKVLVRAAIIWRLDWGGGSDSKMVYAHCFWQKVSVPCWLLVGGHSSSPCGPLHRAPWISSWRGSWLLLEWVKWESAGKKYTCDIVPEAVHHCLCHVLLMRSELPSLAHIKGEGDHTLPLEWMTNKYFVNIFWN